MSQEEANKDLIIVPPGKYLLADKNEFIRIVDHTTGLLISNGNKDQNHSYKLVLLNDKVILI